MNPFQELKFSIIAVKELIHAHFLYHGKNRRLVDNTSIQRRNTILSFALEHSEYFSLAREQLVDKDPTKFITSKNEYTENFDKIITNARVKSPDAVAFMRDLENIGKKFRDNYIPVSTSGTTGVPGVYIWDMYQISRSRAILFQRIFAESFRLHDYLVAFLKGGVKSCSIVNRVHSAGLNSALHMPWVLRKTFPITVIYLNQSWDSIVNRLNEEMPTILITYPSVLEVLIDKFENGTLVIKPQIMTVFWEPMNPILLKRIEKVLPGIRIVQIYSCTECLALTTSCKQGKMHINEDLGQIIPLDEKGNIIVEEKFSDSILVTNYLNKIQPIINYQIKDQIRIIKNDCTCGSPFQILEVSGRVESQFTMLDKQGKSYSLLPIMMEVNVFIKVEEIKQFQVFQESRNSILVHLCLKNQDDAKLVEKKIIQNFNHLLISMGVDSELEINFKFFENGLNENVGTKKFKQFNSMGN